ncbi:MAG: sulfurtransferase [Gammaproteobacteria bacterium]
MFKTLIDCKTLARNLENLNWVIVDCRYDLMDEAAGERFWLESHVPGAVYASVSKELSGDPVTDCGRHPMPSPEAMAETFSKLGIDSSKQVVVYDDMGGAFCARLWWMLRYMQHDAVAILDGGWSRWQQEQRVTESGVVKNRAVTFKGQAESDRLVVIDQLAEESQLVDSRDPDRYQGKLEPIDRAAGHIPGAINHFWKNNLDEEGSFLEPEILAENFNQLFDQAAEDGSSAQTVFYCGSGVTACHNIFASVHAGLAEPKLYGGSWSEWSSDPNRPVATGER